MEVLVWSWHTYSTRVFNFGYIKHLTMYLGCCLTVPPPTFSPCWGSSLCSGGGTTGGQSLSLTTGCSLRCSWTPCSVTWRVTGQWQCWFSPSCPTPSPPGERSAPLQKEGSFLKEGEPGGGQGGPTFYRFYNFFAFYLQSTTKIWTKSTSTNKS